MSDLFPPDLVSRLLGSAPCEWSGPRFDCREGNHKACKPKLVRPEGWVWGRGSGGWYVVATVIEPAHIWACGCACHGQGELW